MPKPVKFNRSRLELHQSTFCDSPIDRDIIRARRDCDDKISAKKDQQSLWLSHVKLNEIAGKMGLLSKIFSPAIN